jgi:hypothetical protein
MYDEKTYNLFFPKRSDAIVRMVSFEPDFGAEQYYFCMDTFSYDALVE